MHWLSAVKLPALKYFTKKNLVEMTSEYVFVRNRLPEAASWLVAEVLSVAGH